VQLLSTLCLLSATSAQTANDASANASALLDCYYCGVRELCDMPFDEETSDTIKCTK
jgi:hypothetical protein